MSQLTVPNAETKEVTRAKVKAEAKVVKEERETREHPRASQPDRRVDVGTAEEIMSKKNAQPLSRVDK